jgi:hypothetical protein
MDRVLYDINRKGLRQCSGCTLCCKLLPVRSLNKLANTKCQHQSSKGCAVYRKPWMPHECTIWSCRWLNEPEATAKLSRPDRSHYVIDMMPDYVTAVDDETGAETKLEVVQVWCDPAHRDAHRDPALRAYLEEQAKQGIGALIRYGSREAFFLMAPSISHDKQWHEMAGQSCEVTHTPADLVAALGDRMQLQVTMEESE